MIYNVELKNKTGIFDALGQGVRKDILDLGIKSVKDVSFIQVYLIEASCLFEDIRKICDELLVDKVTQEYSLNPPAALRSKDPNRHIVEIAYNPGVMDPVEESTLKGIRDLGVKGVTIVKTAKKYIFNGKLSPAEIRTISDKLLYNKLIQHIVKPGELHLSFRGDIGYNFKLNIVKLINVSDRELERISKDGQLFLNIQEMRRIREYFKHVKRNPTDCELETIAQTWSEHCWHKTFRGIIEYTEEIPDQKPRVTLINNLLKSTIMKATKELNKPWCVSVFKDNAGVIEFDERHNICFKVETHNHPSALEPFGGANTGVGGVIRDCLGTGLGAKPILNTDVFCFASPEHSFKKLPSGCLHPKRVMKGVVCGVRDYGNKMGIPTVNGAILFHEKFVGNPLVYCGTVGIMPKDKSFKKANKGDFIVCVGGKTGRDGIHGATFSSGELTHESEVVSSGAVQIGNPIQEKKVLDVLLQARDQNLYSAITDCGAGGLSSAVGEMAQELGARVYLDRVPLKYSGLSYTETWISESQERMVVSVPKESIAKFLDIFSHENVEATIIGELTDTKRLKLYYQDNLVCDLDMVFLHEGIPQDEKKAVYIQSRRKDPDFPSPKDLTGPLLKLLSDYDICSKEWVIRQYDHEVQGGSVIKPLAGIANDGPSDAAVVRPVLGSKRGVVVSNGINFRYGFIDPYWMAASCIDEALRQIIAVGGSLKEVALLDNFCWGNPDKPDRLGSMVRAARGCYDFSKGFGVPFISGKDSLNNEYTIGKESIAIPGTLLISAMGVMEDTDKTISMYAKEPGDLVYIVGDTYPELGASHYYNLFGYLGNDCPRVFIDKAKLIFDSLSRAAAAGLISAMHDCSEGGLGVACAEMAFSGGLGMDLFLSEVPYTGHPAWPAGRRDNGTPGHKDKRNDFILFSQSNSRFIVEVRKKDRKAFEKMISRVSSGLIGCISGDKNFKIHGLEGNICLKAGINELKSAWQKPLRW